MSDVATLGIRVTADGVAQATQGLNSLAAAGAKAEDATVGLTASQKALAQQGVSLQQVVNALNGTTSAGATANDKSRAMLVAHARALADDEAMTRRLALSQLEAARADQVRTKALEEGIYNTRQMALLQAEANALNESGGKAAGVHGLQLGRLNQELGTASGRLLGVNTAATRLIGQIGGAVTGYGAMIAILAGVAISIEVIEKLAGYNAEAKKQQDELTKSLEKWYDTEKRGAAGERVQQIEAEIASVKKLSDEYQRLKKNTPAAVGAGEGGLTVDFGAFTSAQDKKALSTKGDALVAAQKDVTTQMEAQYVADLSNLISHDHASEVERQRAANTLIALQQRLRDGLNLQGTSTATLGERSQLVGWIDDLDKALNPQKAAQYVNRLASITDAINRFAEQANETGKQLSVDQRVQAYVDQLTAVQRSLDDDVARHKISRDEYTKDAAALADLATKAKNAGDALNQSSSDQLTQRLRQQYDAQKQVTDAYLANATGLRDLTAAQKAQNEIDRLATEQGRALTQEQQTLVRDRYTSAAQLATAQRQVADAMRLTAEAGKLLNIELSEGKKEIDAMTTAAQKWLAVWEQMKKAERDFTRSLHEDLAKAVDDLAQHGLGSFQSFFQTFEQGFTRVFDLYEKRVDDLKTLIEKANSIGASDLAASLSDDLKKVQKIADILGNVQAGVSGALSGYAVGQATGDQASGAFGGALAGGAAGAPYGAWGIVIGGLSGAAGGLLGASAAQEKAAEAMRQAAQATVNSIGDFYNQSTGFASTSGGQIEAASQKQSDLFYQLVRELDAGAISMATFSAQTEKLTQATQHAIDAIQHQAALQEANDQLGLQVQILQAKGLTAQAAELQRQIDLFNAYNGGKSPEYIALLQQLQQVQRDNEAAAAVQAAQQQAADDAAKQRDLLRQMVDATTALQQDFQQQIAAQNQTIDATQAIVTNLQKFRDSLSLNSQLSILSPTQQLALAKSQYQSVLASALKGDATAASSLPDAAQSLLSLSRNVNASGPGYVSDFRDVQAGLGAVQDQFGAQLSTEQLMLKELQKQNDTLQKQVDLMNAQLGTQKQSAQLAYVNTLLQNTAGQGTTSGANLAIGQIHQLFPGLSFGVNPMSGTAYLQNADFRDPVSYYTDVYRNTDPEDVPTAIRTLLHNGGVPGYAAGGDFAGGLMRVGELGQELVATGRARVTNSRDLDAPTVAELQALRADVEEMKAILRAGFKESISAQQSVGARVDANTTTTSRGFDGLKKVLV